LNILFFAKILLFGYNQSQGLYCSTPQSGSHSRIKLLNKH